VSHVTGLIVETLVAALLLLTIGYCMLLNKRLKRLKADEQSLKATIGELITATEIAERAIGGLKMTVRDCDQNLGAQLAMANEMSDRLKKQTLVGEEVLHRLSRIALAARPADSAKDAKPAAKSIVAAAQAFAERRKANGLAA
jgi:ribosomal protein L11